MSLIDFRSTGSASGSSYGSGSGYYVGNGDGRLFYRGAYLINEDYGLEIIENYE